MFLAKRLDVLANCLIRKRENAGGKDRCVFRAGFADRERAHRNSARHLRGRKKRIQTVQSRLHRHTENRQTCVTSDDARQMRSASGGSDDDLESTSRCFARELGRRFRCAVRGKNVRFVRHAKLMRVSTQFFIVSQSDALPIMTATREDSDPAMVTSLPYGCARCKVVFV